MKDVCASETVRSEVKDVKSLGPSLRPGSLAELCDGANSSDVAAVVSKDEQREEGRLKLAPSSFRVPPASATAVVCSDAASEPRREPGAKAAGGPSGKPQSICCHEIGRAHV